MPRPGILQRYLFKRLIHLNLSWKVSTWKDGVSHDFVGDKAPDAHHGGTSVVQFNGALGHLGLLVIFVPSKVKGSVSVVTWEFSFDSWDPNGLSVDNLSNSEESSHLEKDVHAVLIGDKGWEGSQTIRDALGSWESDSGSCGQVSSDGKHGNTSVLQFILAKDVESFLVSILDKAKGIENAKL